MTCKDCVHYDVCEDYKRNICTVCNLRHEEFCMNNGICDYFKDKSKYIELPCKVGDTRIYTAAEVTFDYHTAHHIRVDYMQFKPINHSLGGIERGCFYCYEIKSCKEDFESGHGLNFIGDFNYLVLPEGLFEELKHSIPYDVGVYEPSGDIWKPLKCVKKARRVTRKRSVAEMLLMMFRSSNRELIKKEG